MAYIKNNLSGGSQGTININGIGNVVYNEETDMLQIIKMMEQ